jgi:hypothetical protein
MVIFVETEITSGASVGSGFRQTHVKPRATAADCELGREVASVCRCLRMWTSPSSEPARPAWQRPGSVARSASRSPKIAAFSRAASVSFVDHHVGQLVQLLEELGQLDNSLILVTSDNGASVEGGSQGWAFGLLDAAGFRARALYGMYLALLAVASDAVRPELEAQLQALERELAASAERAERGERLGQRSGQSRPDKGKSDNYPRGSSLRGP